MATSKVSIAGEKELIRMLKDLAPKAMKAAIREASRNTMKEVLADAKSMAPHDTGLLESSLTVRTATKIGRNRIGHTVVTKDVFGGKDAFYAHFVEFGTKHGIKADPFLRPALWGNQDVATANFKKFLRAAIDNLALKTKKPKPPTK